MAEGTQGMACGLVNCHWLFSSVRYCTPTSSSH